MIPKDPLSARNSNCGPVSYGRVAHTVKSGTGRRGRVSARARAPPRIPRRRTRVELPLEEERRVPEAVHEARVLAIRRPVPPVAALRVDRRHLEPRIHLRTYPACDPRTRSGPQRRAAHLGRGRADRVVAADDVYNAIRLRHARAQQARARCRVELVRRLHHHLSMPTRLCPHRSKCVAPMIRKVIALQW